MLIFTDTEFGAKLKTGAVYWPNIQLREIFISEGLSLLGVGI